MAVLTEKFRFIRDDVFICPYVNTVTGEQRIKFQKVNLETNEIEIEEFIDGIYTPITMEEYDEYKGSECIDDGCCKYCADEFYTGDENNDDNTDEEYLDFQEDRIRKTLEVRYNESFEKKKLSPEEKFIALKSWAASVSEAGRNAFRIHEEIVYSQILASPIADFLLKFMTKVDPNFIFDHLSIIEKESINKGGKHGCYLISNIFPILDSLRRDFNNGELKKSDRKIISEIIDMDPDIELFTQNLEFLLISTLVSSRILDKWLKEIEDKSIFNGIRNDKVFLRNLAPLHEFIKKSFWLNTYTKYAKNIALFRQNILNIVDTTRGI